MACRVGITTDIETRKAYWVSKCRNFRDWQTMKTTYDNKADAQAAEDSLAAKHGCDSAPGGDDPDDPNAQWRVYYFEHDGCSE